MDQPQPFDRLEARIPPGFPKERFSYGPNNVTALFRPPNHARSFCPKLNRADHIAPNTQHFHRSLFISKNIRALTDGVKGLRKPTISAHERFMPRKTLIETQGEIPLFMLLHEGRVH